MNAIPPNQVRWNRYRRLKSRLENDMDFKQEAMRRRRVAWKHAGEFFQTKKNSLPVSATRQYLLAMTSVCGQSFGKP